jgi:hypothetical protein
MAKAILEFNLEDYDDKEAHKTALKGQNYRSAIFEVGQQVFRPARKHGYPDEKISSLLRSLPEGKGEELIGLLEEKFYEVLRENDANDD